VVASWATVDLIMARGTATDDTGTPLPAVVDDDGRSRLVAAIGAQVGSEREARWIVEHVESAGIPGGPQRDRAVRLLADRRATGEPLQYILGRWPFRGLDLRVDPRVLIPRPETEQVVEVALAELGRREGLPPSASCTCVDLGTGSGAIALSLAVEAGSGCPDLEVWATDRSADALEVARVNLTGLAGTDAAAAARVRLAEGSWFGALPSELIGRVDLVVSNPPYVAASEYPDLEPTVRAWEPVEALVAERGVGGVEGMAAIEAIIGGARRWLRRTGSLVVEIAPHQAYASIDAGRRAGFSQVSTERDLAGRLRVLVARC
jgi:release factor glutamine methyltransferase